MKSIRIERINSEIQKAVSHIIDNDIRDPQIDAIISVSNVETTPDLSYCRIFITIIYDFLYTRLNNCLRTFIAGKQ